MKVFMGSFQSLNRIGRVGIFIDIAATVSGIIVFILWALWAIQYTFNETIPIIFIGFGLPVILGLVASFYGIIWLMYGVFVYSLPLSLYAAMTPSVLRFFLLVSLGYLASAILLTLDRKVRR
ncbi:hypothetical protein SDC9_35665 [bioreactor metagenome]|uniref:Uncharacterized protein n=1 Tax=bioreactor metagenome TaxID=1076179 RepID=A0A644VG77_9ZZZZ|nr:hypothetical protein [Desulfitobacterium hafniense]MEA5023361.1 hypothetical protein [Desulfitobacterium hafniense]